ESSEEEPDTNELDCEDSYDDYDKSDEGISIDEFDKEINNSDSKFDEEISNDEFDERISSKRISNDEFDEKINDEFSIDKITYNEFDDKEFRMDEIKNE
ncbi:33500_t:CDS:1, partial [Racocetra persica]